LGRRVERIEYYPENYSVTIFFRRQAAKNTPHTI
jgi:hypothetical protein